MIKKDFVDQIQRMRDDDKISIVLKQPGVGGTRCVDVKGVASGFDWDNGKILVYTETPVVTDEHLDSLQKYARAFEKLLYLYAMENGKEFMGRPLMGSKTCPKGTTARQMKEYMIKYVDEYLGNPK